MPVCALICTWLTQSKLKCGNTVPEHMWACDMQSEKERAEDLQSQDSANAQQVRSSADADKEQTDLESQQGTNGGAQPVGEEGVMSPQQNRRGSRIAGEQAATDVSLDKQGQKGGGDSGGRGAGIWVIDLTVDNPGALQDGEDTYMVWPVHLAPPCICTCMHTCIKQGPVAGLGQAYRTPFQGSSLYSVDGD